MMDRNDAAAPDPPRVLIDLAEERLDPSEIEAVELWLGADGLTPPPPWVLRRAERIARQRPRPRPSLAAPRTAVARRIIAALTFDSALQPRFAGLRASGTHVRRLLFQAENVEVDLEMTPEPAGERIRVAGQVTAGGADPSGGYLRLSNSGNEWRAPLDESGEFYLDSLTPGAYRLEVVLPDRVVEVPVLPI
jgi:hypothetical protein